MKIDQSQIGSEGIAVLSVVQSRVHTHTHLKAGLRHRFTTVPGVRSRQTQASAVNLPMTCLIRWSNSCLLFLYYNCSGNPPASIFCLCSGPLAYLGGSHLSHVVVLKRLLMNKPVSLSSPLILHRPTELQFRYSKLSHCFLSHFISGNLFQQPQQNERHHHLCSCSGY